MTMPADVIERLKQSVTTAASAGADASAGSRQSRGDDRLAVGTTVSVSVSPVDTYAAHATMRMRLADYSPGGVGLLCGDSISIGSEVTVHLPKAGGGGGGGNYDLRCVVCNCRSVADGVYRIGVRFEGFEK
jgi:c-di-GMP-binding flagellar brake protein YcgR